jgi:3-hydroxyacyl-CoA dehydrogenase/enoyl-CoA hydratase/3-hydroxybutyryl-CoA epimerase
MRAKIESGVTGQKSGKGNYDWANGKPQKPTGGNGPGGEITDRLILPMLDACVECLRLKVVSDRDRLDAAMIFATGFAPFRGGPMHYVETEGAANIKGRLQALAERHGPRFTPDKGWDEV